MADAMELKRDTGGETFLGSFMKFFLGAVGSKVIMAVTGLGLGVFIIGHLAGNLLAFAGRDAFNAYAIGLKGNAILLWGTRAALFIGFPLHILAAVRSFQLNRQARPVPYAHANKSPASTASKTMMLSGSVVLAYFLYHIAHFTLHLTGPQPMGALPDGNYDAYAMLVMGFQNPLIALLYVGAMVLLAAHLSHGFYSLFQHLGFWGPKWTPFLRKTATIVAYGICAAFAAIPLSVLLGIIKP